MNLKPPILILKKNLIANKKWTPIDSEELRTTLIKQISNPQFKTQLEQSLGVSDISEDALIKIAIEQAEQINQTNSTDSTKEIWLNNNGSLKVSLDKIAHEIEDSDVKKCHFCRQKAVFKKDPEDKWHCTNCGNKTKLQLDNDMVDPFKRNLPYDGGNKLYSNDKTIKTAQPIINNTNENGVNSGIMLNTKREKLRRKQLEHQQDVEESAKALALDE